MAEIDTLALNPNPLVRALGKQPYELTRADIIHFIVEQGIPMFNLRYLSGDGQLKVLNFVVQSTDHLNRILTMGERVDGSSPFDSVDAASFDLYVAPQLCTAFLNPFSELPILDIMCGFYDVEGNPLASSPQRILRKVQQVLEDETGRWLEALGELEYYLSSPAEELFLAEPQRGYHETGSSPEWKAMHVEFLAHLVRMGCSVKYARSEVGNFIADGLQMVQQEIEFLPADVTRVADEVALTKRVVRRVAHSHDVGVSFSSKVVAGQAGSGMHFHTRLMKDGVNQFSEGAELIDVIHRVVGGYLSYAASLMAFGNPIPTSFLRLVPHQEAPTAIYQEDRNRSVLVRVLLGWQNLDDRMFRDANPQGGSVGELPNDSQTAELRSPDGAANIHLLLAGLIVTARIGLSDSAMLNYTTARYISGDASKYEGLDQLPSPRAAVARCLLDQRVDYETQGVFPSGLTDAWAVQLFALEDENLRGEFAVDRVSVEDLVARYFHIGRRPPRRGNFPVGRNGVRPL